MLPHRDHLPALDGLRGLAVLLVLYGHLPLLGTLDRHFRGALAPHYLGVEVFFVLSGFLITRILLFDFAHGGTIGQFLARRALRIFPIYYLTLAILAVTWPAELGLAKYLVYLQNIVFAFHGQEGPPLNHTWSLAVEEHFYLAWPLVVLALWRTRWLAPAAIVLLVGGWTAMWVHACSGRPSSAGAVAYLTPYRMPTLLAGAMLAIFEEGLRRRPRRVIVMGLLALAAGVVVALVAKAISTRVPIAAYLAARNTSLASAAIGVFCIAWWTALASTALASGANRLLSTSPLRFVGRISYGLYLYHFPIYGATGLARGDDPSMSLSDRLTRGAAALALTFAAATISFYLVERPILRLKGRFSVARE